MRTGVSAVPGTHQYVPQYWLGQMQYSRPVYSITSIKQWLTTMIKQAGSRVSHAEFEYGTYKFTHNYNQFWAIAGKLTELKWKVETRGKPLSTNYETVYHWTGVTGPTAMKLINSVDIQSWDLCASLPAKLHCTQQNLIYLVGEVDNGSMPDQLPDNLQISLLGCCHERCLLRVLEGN